MSETRAWVWALKRQLPVQTQTQDDAQLNPTFHTWLQARLPWRGADGSALRSALQDVVQEFGLSEQVRVQARACLGSPPPRYAQNHHHHHLHLHCQTDVHRSSRRWLPSSRSPTTQCARSWVSSHPPLPPQTSSAHHKSGCSLARGQGKNQDPLTFGGGCQLLPFVGTKC